MSVKYFCDSCGKECSIHELRMNTIFLNVFSLCPKCEKKLLTFIKENLNIDIDEDND